MTERVLLLTALALCHGFNLDTETAVIFQENVKSFGQSVVQLEGSRLVVGAPQEIKAANQTGGLYQCDYSLGTCEPIPLQVPPEAVNMSLGLSLAFATNPFRLLACGPTLHQICKENTYVNGFCFLFGSNLRQSPERFPKALRECPQQESDIAFLIDGSGSINRNDFQRMKNFVSTVMRQFTKSKTLFSLMQYSDDFRTHFTFKDFKNNPNPRGLVTPIEQLTGYTYTATGILKVVTELFSSNNGARKNALKILVVITDGEKYGDAKEYKDVIPEADRRGVIRYVIGVGSAFNNEKSRQELNTIASQPPREHVFQVNNFEALKTIQNQLQEKIFAIEGTQTGSTSSFEYEMSQEGFSASITSNGPLLGAVGSFDWAGGAFLHMPQDKITFINTTRVDSDMNDAYLGYAAEVVLWGRVQTLVLGAPRYQHTGMVVMFRQSANVWETSSVIKGTQIGSYFGASLCSVDVDRDGSSDLVLIGAPHYYEPTRGGQVSVCPLPRGQRSRWQCEAILRGEQGHPWGRFGTALTVLGDVNGDKLTDVAIGAPGEQENQGAVYLFHGTSGRGIRPSHSQRIAGSQLSPRLQYFGQSLSGGKDLTMDGLMDLAVGAQGRVLLLRSKPVLRVEVTMNFAPRELMRNVYECREHVVKGQTAGEVRVCLRVHKSTRDRLREGEVQSTITYDLALDSTRQLPRAIFDETKNSTRRQTQVFGQNQKCETLTLRLPDCVEDSVIPIGLRLNFSLVGQPLTSFGNLRPVLAVDAQTLFTASFPFEKNCGNDSVCQDDLSITLSFMNLRTLVVGGSQDFNVTVTVKNQGEDSYRTQVAFFYPPGLSYRTVSGIQTQHSWRSWRVNCGSETTQGPETLHTGICSINHPIFPGNSEVTFNIILGVDNDASLGNRLLFKANVTSDNNMPRTNKTEFQLELPVKYTVYMVISSHEASTRYLNFTASEKTSHDIKHQYQFNNLGRRSVPVSVVFWIPTQLNQVTVWDHPQIVFSQNLFNSCRVEERAPPRSDFLAELKKSPELNCSIAVCQRTQCDIQSFGSQEQFSVTLKGNLSFDWYIKTPHSYLEVVSTAEILFDDTVFTLFPGQEEFVRVQTKTKVEPYEVGNPVPLIVGSSVGGLVLLGLITAVLYKLGFFKRQYKDMMSETAPEAAPPQ
ncbi:integrin alpha-M-like isoform X1 [Molossus molossus]|uniref:Integrin subunit alpha M n=2 Tax=Molossus molossus TaxID=27622 RepID=A0A7J8IZU7_MOLMO|nr:integrin alpha-M-like isoform X1 [Molossus molossus]KAF6489740.1 integrin subunit alpha M [Molossus molossus]